MAYEGNGNSAELSVIFESLQSDFKTLSGESKKKYPQVKEACEEAIVKLKGAQSSQQISANYVVNQIIYPLSQGCETKDVKLIRLCLQIMQKLIKNQVVDQKGALYITDTLWSLMELGIEEVKILQTVTLLLTTNTVVHGETLARTLVLCFRLHFTKNSTTINTAGATVRQLVYLVFERVVAEEEQLKKSEKYTQRGPVNTEELKIPSSVPPKGLPPCAGDAFLLFHDLVQLVNADQPYWLIGMTEMTRTFGLELLESVLTQFSSVFHKNAEFSFLLKERVCALVIKLFSPNIKYRSNLPSNTHQATPFEKPYFPISMRLLRVVSILIQKYHELLVTECEIFLSLIVKFLDPDKPTWQRSLALEVLHKMTVQPELLRSFCECYDLNAHTTSIFQDMVNSLGAYVQSLFVNPQLQMGIGIPAMQGQPPVHLAGLSAGPGISAQSGFLLRGVWLPIVVTFPTGQAKSTYLEMLDKVEPPTVPDGYGISVAYACLVETIRSLQIVITPQRPPDGQEGEGEGVEETEKGEADREVDRQLVNSSWCGLLAALAPLVEASTEEAVTENVLKAIQTYTSLCGVLDLQMPRDAFITAICKSSLPPHYALSVLNSVTSGINLRQGHRDSQDLGVSLTLSYGDTDYRQQVVAVGTPLPTTGAPAGAHQGPVMLTAKNLQAMRALLSLAHCHGGILGSSWHLVLTTLQHLVWILGLKPSTGGSLKAVRPASDTNAVITSSVMDNLPVLSTMLSKLFESSRYLDDVALHHLISALCKLSQEAMELAYANREPSLFAVAKLLETGLVNMPRIEVLWRPLTNHLLEVCHHPHIRMRGWGVEAITYLVKAALNFNHAVPLRENQKMQTLLLGPLYELSSVLHGDVRQKQLECVLQILHTNGETLSHGWPLILGIIGAVNDQHGEHLVKIAFQCLQLVITDFLPLMPWRCLPLCVDTVAKFGSQTQELNISLTAVGLMWNISDYFYQNQGKLNQATTEDNAVLPDFPGTLNVSSFDKLWMCLYARLGELCVDSRPAVRKSSGQTLFSTIAAHGGLLRPPTWQIILWQVLFPLLDKVRSLSNSASSEKFDTGGNILIHHTRNTAQKQWAETQVLTLSGVARVFNTKRQLLALGDFPRAWSILLEFIENAALSRNNEVSIAALKSFQEILFLSKNQTPEDKTVLENREIWAVAWKIWVKIGVEMTDGQEQEELYLPSQTFLTTLVQIFPYVFQNVKHDFTLEDLRKFGTVLTNAVSVPVLGETTPPYVISASSDLSLTPLHDGVLHAVELVQKEAMSRNESRMLPDIFRILLTFAQYTCQPPVVGKHAKTADWVVLNYVPFGEKAVGMVAKLYERTAEIPEVIEAGVLEEIVRTLRTPLALKYNCVSASVWKLAAGSLMAVLRCGLKVARAQTGRFGSMWDELYGTLNDFLFPSTCAPGDKGLDDLVTDEAMDCQFIELLRTEVLPHSKHIPDEFIMQVVILLNKGSIHSATNVQTDGDTEITLREEFAKTCFETLLQFSLVDEETGERERREGERREGRELREGRDGDMAGHLAVTSLLHRFQEVLGKYIEDEKLSGKCPLPRYRLSEISFVLKALTTLIISMKKSTAVKEDNKAWEQLISLYPYLVECTTTSSMQVSRPLKEALLQFCDLLQPPHNKNNNNVIRLTDSLI